MNTSLEFAFAAQAGLALLVALPLALLVLVLAERRRSLPSAGGWHAPEFVRRVQAGLLVLCAPAVLAGAGACGFALLGSDTPPLEHPLFLGGLVLLGAVPVLALLGVWLQRRVQPVMLLSSVAPLRQVAWGRPGVLRYLVPLLRFLALAALIVAVARPQVATTEADVFAEGMDIVITLDVSTSMNAVDFAPPDSPDKKLARIDGAKSVIARFIEQRQDDRLGLVVFASEAYTQTPLTLDYSILQSVLSSVKTGVVEDGTAIGNAIMVSVNRLRESEAKSKVVILLTDGDDNASKIAPLQAAEIAAQQDIRIFPILVGKGGLVPFPVGPNLFGRMQYRNVEIRTNPELLQNIARLAKGKFYRSVDQKALEEDFQDILDQMEKTRLMDPGRFTRHTEVFQLLLLPALLALLLELALGWTLYRRFP
ncbi:MAG TPA: VWA domain-containing protein [Myxococcota bacterium]|nr:VWA domain-containing protein [Myxococcota bacterium]HRY94293.1 VWA domain-containing protein [Myxococcota bacterium]HSA24147.1 VWA domain-containing protein [Myxococcota bacterium]